MFRTFARRMQGSAARAMKKESPKLDATLSLAQLPNKAGSRLESMFGVMVGSVMITGFFAAYGGLTFLGRLSHRAGNAAVVETYTDKQLLLRHAGVYTDRTPTNLPSGVNPSQRL